MNDQMEDRILEMVFCPDKKTFVDWLSKVIRGQVFCENDVIYFRNKDIKLNGGFLFQSDYTTKAVSIAFAIAGIQWPFLFPTLLEKVNKQWKSNKSKKTMAT
jgi:hypothetical protein